MKYSDERGKREQAILYRDTLKDGTKITVCRYLEKESDQELTNLKCLLNKIVETVNEWK